ncbi:DUF6252 domain-containing protein [Flavobacterium branchiophilum]|uniref:Probable lipoprotein n=1 Tax=Flavobacterium branchiophilum (strain FL-15) TaxID=1034807 RepID=G2Z5U0_FLABF|nr:DUF6252 family protein [Flavobacterium branchiophilum]CCB68700.1 Probable lipoprotein precursor [Flavobacterium branchiophilum FL-15]
MKKISMLTVAIVSLLSCQKDIKVDNPTFQGEKDGLFWQANSFKATINTAGKLTITGTKDNETLTISTSSKNLGTYTLGTTDTNTYASFITSGTVSYSKYETAVTTGMVSKVLLTNGGTGYTSGSSVGTTGGTGQGLRVYIQVSNLGGITQIKVTSPGNGYKSGDVITIDRGTAVGDAKFIVQNVMSSNGEIIIKSYDGATISGEFKFNAKLTTGSFTDAGVLNYQHGFFYRIPIN